MIALLFGMVVAAAATSSTATAPYRAAVIVGVNASFDSGQRELEYADDDAARFFELLEHHVDHMELLTVLDAQSQRLFGRAAAAAQPPDVAHLERALERTARAAEAARATGRRTELYFIYTGHGRVQGAEGEVKLLDGTLRRSGLAARVLQPPHHDRIHLIVDACNAYHLVNARGPEAAHVTEEFDRAFERFVESQSIDRYPTVGVVLSTSGAGATHEWSRLQGGVFSHEVRSALAGAADANADGRVDYTELEAFLAAANFGIPELKGRPNVFVRAPAIERNAAILAPERNLPVLELPAQLAGHYYVEDDRGLRYAELNKAEGYAVALSLIPRESYALHTSDGASVAEFSPPVGTLRVAFPLSLPKETMRSERGDDTPTGAFQEAFGPSFVEGFRAQGEQRWVRLELATASGRPDLAATSEIAEVPAPKSPVLTVVGYSALGVAVVSAGLAVWQADRASTHFARYQQTFDRTVRDAEDQEVRSARAWAWGLGITAGVAAVTALGSLLYAHWEP